MEPSFKRVETYRQVMYYGVGIGVGVALAGGIMAAWSYRGTGAERRVSAVPVATPQQLGLTLAGRF